MSTVELIYCYMLIKLNIIQQGYGLKFLQLHTTLRIKLTYIIPSLSSQAYKGIQYASIYINYKNTANYAVRTRVVIIHKGCDID